MKYFAATIATILSLFFLIDLAGAHCFSCRKKVVIVPRVKIIRKKVLVPNYSVTYAPSVQPPAIVIPPPQITIPPPTVIQPPAIRIGAPTVTLPAVTVDPPRLRVPVKPVLKAPLKAPLTCEELLQQFKVALDQCEIREKNLQAHVLQLEKRLGIKHEEPKKEGAKKGEEVDPAQAKASARKFVTTSCMACHSKDNAPTRGGENKYVIDFDKLTRNQGLYMLAKVQSGDMPKQPNKYNIKEATEADLNALEDYVNTLR